LKELQRLDKALFKKLAAKVDLDVMKVEIRDVMAQFFQLNLGSLHAFVEVESDSRAHKAPSNLNLKAAKKLREAADLEPKVKLLDDEADRLYEEEKQLSEEGEELFEAAKRSVEE